MSTWTFGRRVAAGFSIVILMSILGGAGSLALSYMTAGRLEPIGSAYLPLNQAASRIECNLLNARVHFVYYSTIRKEGSRDRAMQFYDLAERQLPELRRIIG